MLGGSKGICRLTPMGRCLLVGDVLGVRYSSFTRASSYIINSAVLVCTCTTCLLSRMRLSNGMIPPCIEGVLRVQRRGRRWRWAAELTDTALTLSIARGTVSRVLQLETLDSTSSGKRR